MQIKSNISGEERVIVKGKGWISIKKIKLNDFIKTKSGWKLNKFKKR